MTNPGVHDIDATAPPRESTTLPAADRPGTPAFPATWPVDVAAVLAVLAAGVVAWGPVFGGLSGYRVAGLGVLIGAGVAALVARLRGGPVLVAAGLLVAYFALGGPVALPRTTVAGVLPSLDTLELLLVQAVQAWKGLLTVNPPAAGFTGPQVAPWLAGLCCAAAAVFLMLRGRRPAWVLLPAVLLLVLGILWGTHDTPLATVQGLVVAVVGLSWLSWRAARARQVVLLPGDTARTARRFRPRRAVEAVGLLVVAGLAGALLAGPALHGSPRHVLRDDVEPPLNLHQYASPLTMYRYLERDQKDEVLFTVDGLQEGDRLRLAAVDAYDGIVYNVDSGATGSGGFTQLSPEPGPAAPGEHELSVTVGEYSGVWVPGGRDVTALTFTGAAAQSQTAGLFHNDVTGTSLTTAGIDAGTTYQVRVVPVTEPSDTTLDGVPFASAALTEPVGTPESVPALAGDLTGGSTPGIAQARALATQLQERGFYSDGTTDGSRPGHTTERINTMVTAPQLIGDDEQYAVAMALMARDLGMPARVVMGFYPEEPVTGNGPVALTGSDAHVWVEIAFEGHGWVTFDPTPPRDKEPQVTVPQKKGQPKPQVPQPPEPPKDEPEPEQVLLDNERETEDGNLLRTVLTVVAVVAIVAGVIALLIGPFLLIAALKRNRRRARRQARDPLARVTGGWAEITDLATDLGTPLTVGATRQETAAELRAAHPGVDVGPVAAHTDSYVFGPRKPDLAQATAVWSQVDAVLAGLASGATRKRRVLARFSLRSLRRGWRQQPDQASAGSDVLAVRRRRFTLWRRR